VQEVDAQKYLVRTAADQNIEAGQQARQMQVQPGFLRFLEMCGEYAGRRDDKGRDRQPMREKQNAAPVDAKRRAAGDQKGQGIRPAPPLMDGVPFGRSRTSMPTARAVRLATRCARPSGNRSRFMVVPPLQIRVPRRARGCG
jgi:hypothetical protein